MKNIFQFPFKSKPKVRKEADPVVGPANFAFVEEDDAEVFEPGPAISFEPAATAVKPRATKAPAVQQGSGEAIKIKGTWFVSSVPELARLLERHKKPKMVLRGDLVLMSLNPAVTPGDHYAKQSLRVATPNLKSLLKPDAENSIVGVWLLKDAVDRLFANRINAVALEIDQFMQFPAVKKGKKILLTSWKQDRMWPVSALVFKDGVVQNFIEKKCKAKEFERDVRQLLEQLRNDYADYELIWADPADQMPDFLPAGTQNVGAKPYASLVRKPILGLGEKVSLAQRYGLSAFIALLAIVGYAGGLAMPYQDYANIRGKSQDILRSFNADKEFTTEQLGVLQARRFFISEPRAQAQQTDMLRKAILAVNKLPQRVWIQDLKLTAAEPGKKKGEIKMTLRVIKDIESDGVTQLKGIPLALSNELGFPIRTSGQNGIQDVTEAKRSVRQIKLEGEF